MQILPPKKESLADYVWRCGGGGGGGKEGSLEVGYFAILWFVAFVLSAVFFFVA